jgi:lipoate-protein ligase A
MAIDEAIAVAFSEGKVPPTLRLYQWETPALTIGSFQKIDDHLSGFLKDILIPVIRRITGGRALLHDREVTYSIVGRTDDPLFAGGLRKTFYAVASGLVAGLRRLGVDAEIDLARKTGVSQRAQKPFCLQSISWCEIAVSGKKLVGSAQKRWSHFFLQHGSLLLTPSPLHSRYANGQFVTLSDLLPHVPSRSEIDQAIRIGFETALQIRLIQGVLTPEEKASSDRLIAERYGHPDWNHNRKKYLS